MTQSSSQPKDLIPNPVYGLYAIMVGKSIGGLAGRDHPTFNQLDLAGYFCDRHVLDCGSQY